VIAAGPVDAPRPFRTSSGTCQAVATSIQSVILHLQELFHIGEAKLFLPRSLILAEDLELAGSDAAGSEGVWLCVESLEAFEKAASDFGPDVDRFAHMGCGVAMHPLRWHSSGCRQAGSSANRRLTLGRQLFS
jgi:hypothetical protein